MSTGIRIFAASREFKLWYRKDSYGRSQLPRWFGTLLCVRGEQKRCNTPMHHEKVLAASLLAGSLFPSSFNSFPLFVFLYLSRTNLFSTVIRAYNPRSWQFSSSSDANRVVIFPRNWENRVHSTLLLLINRSTYFCRTTNCSYFSFLSLLSWLLAFTFFSSSIPAPLFTLWDTLDLPNDSSFGSLNRSFYQASKLRKMTSLKFSWQKVIISLFLDDEKLLLYFLAFFPVLCRHVFCTKHSFKPIFCPSKS